ESIKENLGSLQSKTKTAINAAQENAKSFVDVTYSATFEKGSGEIVARLETDGVNWKFEDIEVQSDQLPAAGDAPVEDPAEDGLEEDVVEEPVPAGAPTE